MGTASTLPRRLCRVSYVDVRVVAARTPHVRYSMLTVYVFATLRHHYLEGVKIKLKLYKHVIKIVVP